MCFVGVASAVISLAGAASQPTTSLSPQREPPGRLAAAAIAELLKGRNDGGAFRNMVAQRHKERQAAEASMQDSYPAWLAAELIRRAATGQLFVRDGDTRVALRVTWAFGDNAFWYIGRASVIKADGGKVLTGGPWVLWEHLGELVTPRGPDDDPSVAKYVLPSVGEGDVVEMDIFRLPRKSADVAEALDPEAIVRRESTQLLLRLQLPVVISRESAGSDR